ncbi:MAG: sulfotransferase, partial [Cyanobacteria bacterium J06636_16]
MAEAVAQLIKQGLNLQNRGRVSDAEQVYQRVLAAEPDHAAALHLLGTVALYQQDFDAAINRINQAIARSPKQAMFHHNLGAALRAVGRFDEAQEHYWQALHLQPDYAEAFFNLSAILRGTEPHAPLDALEDLLAKPGTGPEERCFLHFAAGKWYDDRSEYDRAFFHYREGNALRESTFAPDAFEHYVDELIAVFDWAFIERRQHDGFAHDLPVFVIGMPRSGTTLLEQVLAAHPQVLGAGELPSINSLDLALAGQGIALLPTFVGKAHPTLEQRGDIIADLTQDRWIVTHQDDRHRPE